MYTHLLLLIYAVAVVGGNRDVFENTLFPPLPIGVPNSNNTLCAKDSVLFVENLKNLTLWAHEIWDATAKTSSGILRGNIFQMGHFDQCVSARAPFVTQYCLANIIATIPKPNTQRDPISLYHHPQESVFERLYNYNDKSQQSRNAIKMGWCVPATCSPTDLQSSLNEYLKHLQHPYLKNNVSYTSEFSSAFCQTEEETVSLDGASIGFCFLTVVLGAFVIGTTIYDYNFKHEFNEKSEKKSLLYKCMITFSAKRNFSDLTKIDETNSALSILYGMRTICILMIIIGHRIGTFTSSALLNFDYLEMQYRNPMAIALFHIDLFVDSFFILSGLLVAYTLLNQFETRKMNPGFIILMRYVRLTPVYAYVIFYYATLFNYSGSGPLWKVIAGGDSQDCKDNWWTNLLYLSNYINADHMCMTHSWYLPCDFHYFIIAIGVCLLFKKEKKYGLTSLILLLIVSIIIPFALTVIYQRPALLNFYPEFLTGPKIHTDFLLTYSKSHTRATPYFVGMLAGYVYYIKKGTETHVCWIKSSVGTTVAFALILVAMFGGAVFYNPYHEYNSIESACYTAFHRPSWAFGTVGLLYIASYGHASIIYKVLTWSPLIPLSKLVYGAYLVHMQFQLRSAAKFMSPRKIGYFDLMSLALSDMVLAFATALVLYLAVEAPFRRIFRVLLVPSTPHPPKDVEATSSRENMMNNNCESRL